jgi:hypothetical protein
MKPLDLGHKTPASDWARRSLPQGLNGVFLLPLSLLLLCGSPSQVAHASKDEHVAVAIMGHAVRSEHVYYTLLRTEGQSNDQADS